MLGGLLLASISTVLVQSALFQRKSRSGWLDELDEIRDGALRDGELDDGISVSDIWTDLRDGGSYEDPHEISGLYASDDTPDAPGPKEPPRRKEKAKAKGRGRDKAKASVVAEDEAPIADGAPVVDAGPSEVPLPTEAPVLQPPVAPAAGPAPVHEAPVLQPLAEPPATPAPELAPAASAEAEGEQLWVQPAPHPIRPSEMWHPQEMGAPSLGEPSVEPVEERVSSAELDQGRHETPPFEFQAMTAALEAELVAAADVTVVGQPDATAPIESGAGPLVGAPVGRRNRRDRPTLPTAPAATATAAPAAAPTPVAPVAPTPPGPGDRPDVPGHDAPDGPAELPPLAARGETSPLPTEPLPPAAIPAPSAKLPVAPREQAVEEAAAAQVAPAPAPTAPEQAPEPVVDEAPSGAAATVPEGPRLFSRPPTPAALAPSEVQPAEAPAAEPEATPVPAEAASFEVDAPAPQLAAEPTPPPAPTVRALAVADDGMVDVPGTIVRVRSEGEVSATAGDAIVEIAVDRGWTWVSPGDGPATAVRVELPHASVRIAAGATALAVAEVDGSAFVIVADGSVDLERTEGGGTLTRGTVAMVDADGEVNIDQASDAEIEGDPLVAENLALDAEL